mmetsp:Transcript_68906/g.213741  ORF Transcript_68906/g.213741 Transcript_68906/m.213741 type:complete len:227 (+) Transcript_68906:132-812(+)
MEGPTAARIIVTAFHHVQDLESPGMWWQTATGGRRRAEAQALFLPSRLRLPLQREHVAEVASGRDGQGHAGSSLQVVAAPAGEPDAALARHPSAWFAEGTATSPPAGLAARPASGRHCEAVSWSSWAPERSMSTSCKKKSSSLPFCGFGRSGRDPVGNGAVAATAFSVSSVQSHGVRNSAVSMVSIMPFTQLRLHVAQCSFFLKHRMPSWLQQAVALQLSPAREHH